MAVVQLQGALLQQPRLYGLSARARSRVTLRKMLVQFSELFFVASGCQFCAALAKVQLVQPPIRISSAFPNAGGAVEDTQGSFMMERRKAASEEMCMDGVTRGL